MPENGQVDDKASDTASQVFQIQETITVPDRDLSPAEIHKIMKQVSRVCNFLASLTMKSAAILNDPRVAGAAHPVCQNIINCAAQADTAALQLAPQPPQIMSPREAIPVPVPRRH